MHFNEGRPCILDSIAIAKGEFRVIAGEPIVTVRVDFLNSKHGVKLGSTQHMNVFGPDTIEALKVFLAKAEEDVANVVFTGDVPQVAVSALAANAESPNPYLEDG